MRTKILILLVVLISLVGMVGCVDGNGSLGGDGNNIEDGNNDGNNNNGDNNNNDDNDDEGDSSDDDNNDGEIESTNADLSSAVISSGTLTPAFDKDTTDYTIEVDNSVEAITVTPAVEESHASITVNGGVVESGSASGNISLDVGENTITIIVTAEDGSTTKTYTIIVTRLVEPSHNADLTGLALSSGTLTPVFNSDETSYTAEVTYDITSITVTPTASDAGATISVNDGDVESGHASNAVALDLGENTITITVTAEDGITIKTYTAVVTQLAEPSHNANLAGLVLSLGTLSPEFSSDETDYVADVPYTIASVKVIPTAAGVNATISLNGGEIESGDLSSWIDLSAGENTITVIVTAEDETTTKTYTITVDQGLFIPLSLPLEVSHLAGSFGGFGSDDGVGADASFQYPRGITTDGANLYVVDSYNHSIRKIVIATGEVTTIAGKSELIGSEDAEIGTNARFRSPCGITTDGTNLYVTDISDQTIRQIEIGDDYTVTTIAGSVMESGSVDGNGSSARFNYPYGITAVGGYLYVTDHDSHAIRKVEIGDDYTVTTIAGSAGTSGSDDAVAGTNARFKWPYGITNDGTNLYVVDHGNHTIRQIEIGDDYTVTTIAGISTSSGSADNEAGTSATFNYPQWITTDGTNLYVTDSNNHKIRQVEIADDHTVLTIAGGTTYGYDDAVIGTNAKFFFPAGITNSGGNLYVADYSNNIIRGVAMAVPYAVTTLAGTANEIGGSQDGNGTAARFYAPQGITNDGTYLYVADSNNHTIRQVEMSDDYTVTTIAGSAGAFGSADGNGTAARFYFPKGITNDGTNLYVTDYYNHTIRQIEMGGDYTVTTIAGSHGVTGSTDAAIGTDARFYNPSGIATDGINLYVADNGNRVIRQIEIGGDHTVTTIAGAAGVCDAVDDPVGTSARFCSPTGMAVYGRNLYVTDTGTETIRRIEIDGDHTVTTIAGINWCNGSADGTGTEATFGGPYGITTDGQNLYITDIWHYNIRKMVIETGVVTTLIGLVDHPGWADGASDEATFFRPQFIDYFGGSLFVSEANNDIRKIE